MWENILTADNLWFLVVGALISLLLAIGALAIGLIIGIFGAMGRISKNRFAKIAALALLSSPGRCPSGGAL